METGETSTRYTLLHNSVIIIRISFFNLKFHVIRLYNVKTFAEEFVLSGYFIDIMLITKTKLTSCLGSRPRWVKVP